MSKIFKQQLPATREKIDKTKAETEEARKMFMKKLEFLVNYAAKYENSWAGNWASDADFYYEDFNTSSSNGMHVNLKYLNQELRSDTRIDIDKLRDQSLELLKLFQKLQEFILSELSFINDIELFKTDVELPKSWKILNGAYERGLH